MNKNDLVSRFREKTDKHWHPFMGVDTTIEKKADMAAMTEEDYFEIKVYPKAHMSFSYSGAIVGNIRRNSRTTLLLHHW